MFLSRLTLSPDSRRVWAEIANPYEMHRTIMSAFPPNLEGFKERVLFRVDQLKTPNRICLLIQSLNRPHWPESLVEDYLAEKPEIREFEPVFATGMQFHFRLRANPTFKRNGKRLAWLAEEGQLAWLARKGEASGFRVCSVVVIEEPEALARKGNGSQLIDITMFAVRFEGQLVVTDPARFSRTMKLGIGSGKGLGFGLLSLSRSGGREVQ